MKKKLKKIFTNVRVIILLFFIAAAIIAIRPDFDVEGVAIRSIVKDSAASLAGIPTPKPTDAPRAKERIIAVNGIPIHNEADFYREVNRYYDEPSGTAVRIATSKNEYGYGLVTLPILEETNETEEILVNVTEQKNRTVFNTTTNESTIEYYNETTEEVQIQNKTVEVGIQDLGLRVYDAPTTNIRKGLDLQGGTRVLLEPAEPIAAEDMQLLIENMKQRLNVYGLSDVVVRQARDLVGSSFIIVEIAGVNEEEVKDLIANQGKFEAKIGNETVFIGGSDILYVARSADQSGIDPQRGCSQSVEGWFCAFRFAIALSPEAAQRQADVTSKLALVSVDEQGNPLPAGSQYLEEQMHFYLDDELTDSLNVGADLKGRAVTDIQISGSGFGATQTDAQFDALENMKQMQTVLITGSLPVKLNIVKTDTLSPALGKEFLNNALLVGALALLVVGIVMWIVYRTLNVVIPLILIMISESIILLGFASLVGWNIDLAAIAGIIIAIGTGVDSQIVIADEVVRKKTREVVSWKQKIKNAFFIITAAYCTTVAAMAPLLFAGAGLVKGFALITIAGISFGVFITRPAFAAIVENLVK